MKKTVSSVFRDWQLAAEIHAEYIPGKHQLTQYAEQSIRSIEEISPHGGPPNFRLHFFNGSSQEVYGDEEVSDGSAS